MYFATGDGTVLVEIKSCDGGNVHSQIRKGISQLFEYRYIYKKELGRSPLLVLILETEPIEGKAWLVDYVGSLGVVLVWKASNAAALITTGKRHRALEGIVTTRKSSSG